MANVTNTGNPQPVLVTVNLTGLSSAIGPVLGAYVPEAHANLCEINKRDVLLLLRAFERAGYVYLRLL
jgi:hypothetical protein